MASTKATVDSSKGDSLKWLLVVLLVAAAVVGNFYFASQPFAYRLIGIIVITAVAIVVGLQTLQGKRGQDFLREAQIELRKVVWPTRQETIQTTMVVIGIVLVTGLFMWAVDSFLLWGIGKLAGHGM